MSPKPNATPTDAIRRMCTMFNDGFSIYSISKRFKLGAETVRALLMAEMKVDRLPSVQERIGYASHRGKGPRQSTIDLSIVRSWGRSGRIKARREAKLLRDEYVDRLQRAMFPEAIKQALEWDFNAMVLTEAHEHPDISRIKKFREEKKGT